MNARQTVVLAAVATIATGCGAAQVIGRSSAPAAAHQAVEAVAPRPAATPPAASPPPSATPEPAPAAPQEIVVTESGSLASLRVDILSATGHVLASAPIPQGARWTVGPGPHAAYWVDGTSLRRLDDRGDLTTVATVPASQSGRVVVAPDGSQWAYATFSQSSASLITNSLYRGAPGGHAVLVATRVSDLNHPSADAPSLWQYYPMSWTSRGILVERQPAGGCGCGVAFDMEMSAGYAAWVDPVTGAATPVRVSSSCPLSGIADDGTAACFDATGGYALDLVSPAGSIRDVRLSGRNVGGDAVFSATTLAYATVPNTAGGCGGPDWQPQTTLRVMNLASGTAHAVGVAGLAPKAWRADGSILATRSVAGANGTTNSLVAVNPVTGATTTLLARTVDVVGLA